MTQLMEIEIVDRVFLKGIQTRKIDISLETIKRNVDLSGFEATGW